MLLDTSGLLCCFDADEHRHADAVHHYDSASRRLTHNYVVAEFIALSQARRMARQASLEFAAAVMADDQIEMVWVDAALHEVGMQLLKSHVDKTYSICDAISFVLMQQRGISDSLTTDRHFEQAGFHRLLPP